jgi:tRNA pseudouridine55 synthase
MSLEPSTGGGLIVDKPSGPTSHDIVALARRALDESRIGHTGTLDPLATGVLVLLIGRATRLSQFLVSDEKEYLADVRLGVSTPTYDADFRLKAEATGNRLGADESSCGPERSGSFRLRAEDLDRALERFRGTYFQTPPPYSAKKIAGRRAYEHARNQNAVELKPVEVTVSTLDVIAQPDPELVRLRVVCSAGFYIRSLAHDLGAALGCGAHLESLRRIRAGRFRIEHALPVGLLATRHEAARERMIPPNDLLSHLAAVTLSAEGARRAGHGNSVALEHVLGDPWSMEGGPTVRLVDASGAVLAVAERRDDELLHPLTVLV